MSKKTPNYSPLEQELRTRAITSMLSVPEISEEQAAAIIDATLESFKNRNNPALYERIPAKYLHYIENILKKYE